MKIFIHRFILLLLLLLQCVSPLVHAHVHAEGSNNGVHFHGINAQASQQTEILALDILRHRVAIIELKQAIFQKKLLDEESVNNHFSLRSIDIIPPFSIAKHVAIATYTMPLIPSIRWSLVSPRAPPL